MPELALVIEKEKKALKSANKRAELRSVARAGNLQCRWAKSLLKKIMYTNEIRSGIRLTHP
jgi:hypothetical protein